MHSYQSSLTLSAGIKDKQRITCMKPPKTWEFWGKTIIILREDMRMSYVDEVYAMVVEKNPAQPEFHQAVKEVLESLRVVIEANEAE